jgi:hypothetical protein
MALATGNEEGLKDELQEARTRHSLSLQGNRCQIQSHAPIPFPQDIRKNPPDKTKIEEHSRMPQENLLPFWRGEFRSRITGFAILGAHARPLFLG